MSKTLAIIVTFNPDLPILKSQILALSGIEGFIVIDNCSDNLQGIQQLVAEVDAEKIALVQNESNVGLAIAQNQGIARSRELGAEHIIMFDQDSVPEPRMVEKLLEAETQLLAAGKKVGAVGPVTFDPDTMADYPITRYKGPMIQRYHTRSGEIAEASFIIASGSLIRMSVLDDVGVMLDPLFIDYIDVEWCYRVQSYGYTLYVAADARMSHRVGDKRVRFFGRSISQHSPLRRYYLTRNSLYVLRLPHIPFGYKVREISLNLARFIAFLYFSNERRKYLKYVAKAVVDGVRGNFGKLEGI
jgi:rhamnosyltransferase